MTGGTGTLGRAVVARLVAARHHVRVLSRRRGSPDGLQHSTVRGDLRSGDGLTQAVADTDVIVHCATSTGRDDVPATRRLIDAARSGGRPHLVYVSIVGSDQIPLRYYRAKQECERLVATSGLPWTTVRFTQFHDLLARVFRTQRRLPFVLVPDIRFQPIDVRDVADHLVEVIAQPAVGLAPEVGGPEISTATELARAYCRSTGCNRPVLSARLPGRAFRGFRQGSNLAPENMLGRISFDDFLPDAQTHR